LGLGEKKLVSITGIGKKGREEKGQKSRLLVGHKWLGKGKQRLGGSWFETSPGE
jgi:hypothetical protein